MWGFRTADASIEPRLSEQWFLKYPRVEEAKQAVRDGHIQFFPRDGRRHICTGWIIYRTGA